MDNFDDFTPVKTSSKLASIFEQSKSSTENSSLTYTAPKMPKNASSPKKSVGSEGASATLEIIIAKSVHAYKLTNGAYHPLGKMGLTLIGCKSPPIYQLLVYKTKDAVVCKIRLHPNFVFSILDSNYATFYSEDQQNYSVMFENSEDVVSFSQKLAVVKACTSPLASVITQDVKFSTSAEPADNQPARVTVTCKQLIGDQAETFVASEEMTINMNFEAGPPWIRALRGLKYGAERIIITPRNLSDPWKHHLMPEAKLLIHVHLCQSDLKPPAIVGGKEENTVDSSSEESSSLKKRGAMLEDALTNKSNKSGLLSRVARLGQATLPLKGAIVADLTDSEEDSSPSPKPRLRSKPPSALLREPEHRSVHKVQQEEQMSRMTQPPVQPMPQPVALYQPPYNSQFIMRNDASVFTPLVSGGNLTSPSDASLAVHFSESRTQATELRMGLAKVADKVDLVLNKIQEFHMGSSIQPAAVTTNVDSSGLLSSVQALVLNNQALKGKVEEQNLKIETQNERIYHLLEMSQKSLERNSSSVNMREEEEEKLLKDSAELKRELDQALLKVSTLEDDLTASSKKIKELESANAALLTRLSEIETENQNANTNLKAAEERIEVLNEKCDRLQRELSKAFNVRDEFHKQVPDLAKEVDGKCQITLERDNNIEQVLTDLKKDNERLKEDENRRSLELSQLKAELALIDVLKSENKRLMEEAEELANNKALQAKTQKTDFLQSEGADTKTFMNTLYLNLYSQFHGEEHYTGNAIKQVLAFVIRDMTIKFLKRAEKSSPSSNNEDSNQSSSRGNENANAIQQPPESASIGESSVIGSEESTAQVKVMASPHEVTRNQKVISSNVTSVQEVSSSESTENKSENSFSNSSLSSPVDTHETQGNGHGAQSHSDIRLDSPLSHTGKETDLTYNQIWHTNQPPPLPIFDEDEDENVW